MGKIGCGSKRSLAMTALSCLALAITNCDSSADSNLDLHRLALGSNSLAISQIYGGGGNTNAIYKNDFIEIFNRSNVAVGVFGWSVQYASGFGSTWSVTNLSGFLVPGHYYLIKEAPGAGGTTDLPFPDATGKISMSQSTGKVALVNNQTALTCGTGCFPNASIVDFVGYGSSANSFEGSGAAPDLTNTTSASRAASGCTDSDNNGADFTAGAVNPRNSLSAPHSCGSSGAGGSTGAGGSGG